MPIDTSVADLWWLKPNQGQPERQNNEVAEAYRAAMQVNAQNNYLHQLRGQQIEQAMELKRAKELSDTIRGQGMTEMSSFLSEVARNSGWDDPENEATFWSFGARYPQIFDHNYLTGVYGSTFLEAKRSRER